MVGVHYRGQEKKLRVIRHLKKVLRKGATEKCRSLPSKSDRPGGGAKRKVTSREPIYAKVDA